MKTQVSGSLSLDLSGLSADVADTVVHVLTPAFESLDRQISRITDLLRSQALTDQQAVQAVHQALVAAAGPQPQDSIVATYVVQYLTNAGLALVPVNNHPVQPLPAAQDVTASPIEPTVWDDGR